MNTPLPAVTLENAHVVLEPLAAAHAPALEAAARDGELWKLWFASVPAPGEAAGYIDAALAGRAEGRMLPFAVRERGSGAVVGTTRYCNIDAGLPRLEIGYTWYAARWQRTHLNTACKALLLEHAFEHIGCTAVELRTDFYNQASQRAIEKLGARRDGVLRAHQKRRDGSVRDTVVYSITAAEWPAVKRLLALRLERLAGG
ncbi:MAG: GNAT family protein [Mizugakiibacter sp.]|uniref:GNAT family N-acetyltransferase n=1 Tax=Mizugakiibacter sp. TaxID=1972610 RepID=UPI0031C3969B|nr:GNAT family N-acetyltransferase [Xanthomonadaceae bacterium]